jgi:carbonic anhydrase
MSDLLPILARNARWASERVSNDPEYFMRLSHRQSPEILWIGCSDSRVPANVITGLAPGDVFVHRNIGNLVYPADLNCMSVLQYAVEVLKVKHIVVCGHYGCGGVKAALLGAVDGPVDHWLEPVKQLAREHRSHLMTLASDAERINFLCETNVHAQISNVVHSPVLRRARERKQAVRLHGWIYGLNDGLLRDLQCDTSDFDGEEF